MPLKQHSIPIAFLVIEENFHSLVEDVDDGVLRLPRDCRSEAFGIKRTPTIKARPKVTAPATMRSHHGLSRLQSTLNTIPPYPIKSRMEPMIALINLLCLRH